MVDVFVYLIHLGCQWITSEFRSLLFKLPITHFRHSLETSFSYMEIITGCVSDSQKKIQCLQSLLKDWFDYITQSYVEAEYSEVNALFNQVSTFVSFLYPYHYVE